MEKENRNNLNQQTQINCSLLRLSAGFKATVRDKGKLCTMLGYLIVIWILWSYRELIRELLGIGTLLGALLELAFPAIAVLGVIGLLRLFGGSLGCQQVHENLERAGFVNSAGEYPQLIVEYQDKDNPNVTITEL